MTSKYSVIWKRLISLEQHCERKNQELKRISATPISFDEFVRLQKFFIDEAEQNDQWSSSESILLEDFEIAFNVMRTTYQ